MRLTLESAQPKTHAFFKYSKDSKCKENTNRKKIFNKIRCCAKNFKKYLVRTRYHAVITYKTLKMFAEHKSLIYTIIIYH